MKKNVSWCAVVAFCVSAYGLEARADVKLPEVIGSHMVLQRDQPLPIWGWADPDEEVAVKIDDGAAATAKANAQGAWKVTLPAMKADGKAHKMTVSGKNKIELEDLLVGEVWVGSGQSNMEWPVNRIEGGREAIAAAENPQIRLFHVPKVQANEPAKSVNAAWRLCAPATVGNFSAVLYFFGARIQKDVGVPVGLINASWGGSRIEPWTIADGKGGGMYNGMIAPVKPFAIRGVIWYQGESNVKERMKYADRMKALIDGWKSVWGQDFSFYFVQLASYSGYAAGELPYIWEAQTASLKLPRTGMAVTTDIVHKVGDIHPINKIDVGNRLALWALAKDYGKKDLVYSGPLYKSMKVEGDKIRISFAHTGSGLKSRDDKPLSEFEIAGADGKFVPAEATIDGNTVVVSAKDVAAPANVQFGWRNTANPNLCNKEGLPASPFRTSEWQGATGE